MECFELVDELCKHSKTSPGHDNDEGTPTHSTTSLGRDNDAGLPNHLATSPGYGTNKHENDGGKPTPKRRRQTDINKNLKDNSQKPATVQEHPSIVVPLRRVRGAIVQNCDVYIGRSCKRGGWDLDHSDWNNPFTVWDMGSVDKALQRYEYYIKHERPDLLARLPELIGKRLGCWCKPGPCHGDILLKILEERYGKR